jgi:hypothetical protein
VSVRGWRAYVLNPSGRRRNRFLSQRRGESTNHGEISVTAIDRVAFNHPKDHHPPIFALCTLRSWNGDAAPEPERYDGFRLWIPTHGLLILDPRWDTSVILSARLYWPLSNHEDTLCSWTAFHLLWPPEQGFQFRFHTRPLWRAPVCDGSLLPRIARTAPA